MKSRKIAAAALLAVGFTIGTVEAREPGIASQTPPGLTLGLPIATVPPQGLYLTARTSAYSADLVDSSGKYYGQTADVYVLSNQLTWVPGWEFLGGKYKAFAVIPFVRTDIDHTAGPPDGPAGALGRFSNFGVGDPKIQPVDLAWALGGGWHVQAGFGFYAPISSYDKDDVVKIGADFWTFEPSVGLTYLKDDWHASLQLAYSTNTENASTQYRSGDQVFLNATLTKDVFDGWNIGPVAYFQQQVTDDENNGMFYGPDMPTFGTQRQLAFGGLVNHQFGRFNVTAFYTHEAIAEGTTKGNKFWLNFQTKLY